MALGITVPVLLLIILPMALIVPGPKGKEQDVTLLMLASKV